VVEDFKYLATDPDLTLLHPSQVISSKFGSNRTGVGRILKNWRGRTEPEPNIDNITRRWSSAVLRDLFGGGTGHRPIFGLPEVLDLASNHQATREHREKCLHSLDERFNSTAPSTIMMSIDAAGIGLVTPGGSDVAWELRGATGGRLLVVVTSECQGRDLVAATQVLVSMVVSQRIRT
jgi:hypothetical protein